MKQLLILSVLIASALAQTIGPGVPDSRCPSGTPNPPLHLNDPTNCQRFFKCANGLAMPFECPEGQHWSVENDYCDSPDRANCVEGGSCPAGDPQPPVHLPHPTDCTKFFKCSYGKPYEIDCPPGQHWSVESDYCDWPDRANCEKGESCPAGDPQPPVHLPHPTDCSKFFKCSWGEPKEMDCPPGQHWSIDYDYCDWPDRANCESRDGSTTGKPDSKESTKSNSKESTKGNSKESTKQNSKSKSKSDSKSKSSSKSKSNSASGEGDFE